MRPLSDLGVLLAVSTAGHFVAGLIVGPLTRRVGLGNLLTAALLIGTISLFGQAAAGTWSMLIVTSVGIGFAGGLIDSVINAYVALHHGARTMNLLHAGFGVGATSGPLLVAIALARGLSWRAAYVVLAGAELVLLITVRAVRRRWPDTPEEDAGMDHGHRGRGHVVGLLGVFFLYVGLEVAAGQWSYSLLTRGRDIDEFVAGVWVASYWAGLTGGRLVLVIGYQIAASSLGAAPLPWIGGRLMEAGGLESLGPYLMALAVLMTALHLGSARIQSERRVGS